MFWQFLRMFKLHAMSVVRFHVMLLYEMVCDRRFRLWSSMRWLKCCHVYPKIKCIIQITHEKKTKSGFSSFNLIAFFISVSTCLNRADFCVHLAIEIYRSSSFRVCRLLSIPCRENTILGTSYFSVAWARHASDIFTSIKWWMVGCTSFFRVAQPRKGLEIFRNNCWRAPYRYKLILNIFYGRCWKQCPTLHSKFHPVAYFPI